MEPIRTAVIVLPMDEEAARKEVLELTQRIEDQRAVIDELSDQPDQQREARNAQT